MSKVRSTVSLGGSTRGSRDGGGAGQPSGIRQVRLRWSVLGASEKCIPLGRGRLRPRRWRDWIGIRQTGPLRSGGLG
jgi:hypothetical protein